MIARLAPSIPLVRRTAAIGVVSLFVTRLAKVGNRPLLPLTGGTKQDKIDASDVGSRRDG